MPPMDLSIPERLEKHRTLLEWLRHQTVLTERAIRDLERQEEAERRRREAARRELGWVVRASRAEHGHPTLHRGNCGVAAKHGVGDLLDAEGVLGAIEEYPDLEMCEVCAPWGSLGVDKPADRRPAGEVEFP